MKIMDKAIIKILLSGFPVLVAGAVQAADKELLDILLGNGAITQAQYETLLAKEALEKEDVVQISFGNGSGLNVSSADGRYEVEIGGRLHLDSVWHDYDSRLGSSPVSGTQVRRGRLELDGRFDDNWAWASEMDFAQDQVEVKDFKIGYVTEGGAEFYAGHQKQPYSLSLEMSSNDIPFVERSVDNYMVSEFTDRAIGVRGEMQGEHWFLAAGVFGDSMESGVVAGEEGWGVSARYVWAPIIEEDRVLHLGLRGTQRTIDDASPLFRIRDKTSDFSDLNIVNTGILPDVERVSMLGPEFAASFGPLFVFGEYTRASIERAAFSTLDFDAWHVAATWALTGESYANRYRLDEGEFKNIRPSRAFSARDGGWGGWEVGARLASIDLNDGDFVGGSEEVASLTLNWYLNRNMRIMADWSRILDTDASNSTRMLAKDMDIFTLRTQWNY